MKNVHFSSILAALSVLMLGLGLMGTRFKDASPHESVAAGPSHQLWNELLQNHVSSSGSVDYQGFVTDKARLESYLKTLDEHPPQTSWSRNETMAYWINAYNAFTVHLIVSHFPVKSIRDLEKPWDSKNIQLGGKTYSLNDIEHKILRERYKDARIHFAVNCASISCPPLYNKAFSADKLNTQLDARARQFIRTSTYNKIAGDEAQLSQIFNWYRADFEKEGSLIDYINGYSETKVTESAEVDFLPYNWNLNGK